jgi:hypothetical protein
MRADLPGSDFHALAVMPESNGEWASARTPLRDMGGMPPARAAATGLVEYFWTALRARPVRRVRLVSGRARRGGRLHHRRAEDPLLRGR